MGVSEMKKTANETMARKLINLVGAIVRRVRNKRMEEAVRQGQEGGG
jgi:hypothetical protein